MKKLPTYELSLVPTYSEDGSVLTLIIMNARAAPIGHEDVIDLLTAYVAQLEDPADPN